MCCSTTPARQFALPSPVPPPTAPSRPRRVSRDEASARLRCHLTRPTHSRSTAGHSLGRFLSTRSPNFPSRFCLAAKPRLWRRRRRRRAGRNGARRSTSPCPAPRRCRWWTRTAARLTCCAARRSRRAACSRVCYSSSGTRRTWWPTSPPFPCASASVRSAGTSSRWRRCARGRPRSCWTAAWRATCTCSRASARHAPCSSVPPPSAVTSSPPPTRAAAIPAARLVAAARSPTCTRSHRRSR
mmetsp:Transcript_43696/g.102575  ORF Transcript_43696/g.102575 Transcript_43696/m.102575 type:complete len:242 (-) Transcript_43696:2083-2808(-)